MVPSPKSNRLNAVCCARRSTIFKVAKCDVKKQIAEFLAVLKKNLFRCKNGVNSQLVTFVNRKLKRTAHPQQNLFRQLPYEILLMIFETLPLEALKNLACSCKYLSQVIQSYYLSVAFRRRFNIFDISDFGSFLVNVFLLHCYC
uniref:F-box domain-containing protein n=1 Tax=Panagrolaimus sp. PS1159 TaxID=55785 RepID=A0AC35FJC2_9BILA